MFNEVKKFLLTEGDLKVYQEILIAVISPLLVAFLVFIFSKVKKFSSKMKQKISSSKIIESYKYKRRIKRAIKKNKLLYDDLIYLKSKKTQNKKLYKFEKKFLKNEEERSKKFRSDFLEKTGLTEEELQLKIQDVNDQLNKFNYINHS